MPEERQNTVSRCFASHTSDKLSHRVDMYGRPGGIQEPTMNSIWQTAGKMLERSESIHREIKGPSYSAGVKEHTIRWVHGQRWQLWLITAGNKIPGHWEWRFS